MTTRTAGDELLADIIAHPDDDGLRLIYADWLDDEGQAERAEFIRVQVEMAAIDAYTQISQEQLRTVKRPRHAHSSRTLRQGCEYCEALERRQAELLSGSEGPADIPHTQAWFGPLAFATAISDSWRWHFRRGFVESVSLPLQAWLDHGRALVRAHPLTRVELTDRVPLEHLDGHRWEVWALSGPVSPGLRYAIGRDLFALMAGDGERFHVSFPTQQAARAALSAAALAWARRPEGERGGA